MSDDLADPVPVPGATTPTVPDPQSREDGDLPSGDQLLGVPLRSIFRVRALRGLVLVVVAAAILLWPAPTDVVIAVLAGLGFATYTATTTVELFRHVERRTFTRVLGLGVAAGFAAALVLRPEESLTSVTQTAGAAAVGLAAVTLVRVLTHRHAVAWGIAKVAALTVGGGMLLAFPDILLNTATSVGAGVLAAVGLIQVFVASEPGEHGPSDSPAGALAEWIRRRPEVVEDRADLQEKVFYEGPSSPVRYARFTALMAFASVIASLGVVVESTAVVIGAMLIAPLMVPLMGTSLALTMGWPRRSGRAAGIALSGVLVAIGLSAGVGAVAPRAIDVTRNTEILSRINPTTLDLAIAVAAGAAGAYALSRRDVSDSLPGVAVAIALVPPLSVVGLCWQQGEWTAGNGALLLFITNAAAILIAGGATFVLIGVAPLTRVSESQERLKSAIVALLAAAGVIIVLLALNGAEATRAEVTRSSVDDIIQDWSRSNEGYEVMNVRSLESGTIQVDLAGPGEPPDLGELVAELQEAIGSGVEIRLTWIEQNQVVITVPR